MQGARSKCLHEHASRGRFGVAAHVRIEPLGVRVHDAKRMPVALQASMLRTVALLLAALAVAWRGCAAASLAMRGLRQGCIEVGPQAICYNQGTSFQRSCTANFTCRVRGRVFRRGRSFVYGRCLAGSTRRKVSDDPRLGYGC